jgi:hypothetical protein
MIAVVLHADNRASKLKNRIDGSGLRVSDSVRKQDRSKTRQHV